MTFLFCRKDLPLNEFCDKSESKRRSVKVKGNNHTLVLLGFMLGACVMVCSIEQPRDFLVLGVGGAVGIAGILSLLLAQLEERAYKEMLKKTCAFATAACFLLLGIVPPLAPGCVSLLRLLERHRSGQCHHRDSAVQSHVTALAPWA